MRQNNRDMLPPANLLAVYAAAAVIMRNDSIDGRFENHENQAQGAKRSYHTWGRAAVLFVATSALFTFAQRFQLIGNTSRWLALVVAILGGFGVAMQFYLFLSKKKKTWLLNRFAAERLRSLKFQAYALSASSSGPNELGAKVEQFFKEELAHLEMELCAGVASLTLFSPALAIKSQKSSPAAEKEALEAARAAYRELRIAYQRRFALAEIEKFRPIQRLSTSIADFLYIAGAVLTIAGLAAVGVNFDASIANLIEFLGAAAFVLGLSQTVLDNASLTETSTTRYERYVQSIDECDSELMKNGADFPLVVCRFERIVLEELSQFCAAASSIGYKL